MEVTPFVLKAEEGLSGDISKGEILGRLSTVSPELELAISFIGIEAYHRNIGPEWRYSYITKVLLPHVLILSGPGRTLLIESYPGSRQTTLYAQKSPNLAKIGNMLKAKSDQDFPIALKETSKFLKSVETLKISFRGLVEKEIAMRFMPFLLRTYDVGPGSVNTNVVPFAVLESKVDSATAIDIAQSFHRLIDQIDTSLEQHEQIRDFYREISDDHIRQLTIQINHLKRKLAKELETVKANVVDEIRKLQLTRRDKLYLAEQERMDRSIAALKRLIPLITTIQNITIDIHNRLDLQRNKLMERTFDPEKTLDKVVKFEADLKRSINNLRSSQLAMNPQIKEIQNVLKKIQQQAIQRRKEIEEEYKEDLKYQESRPSTLEKQRNQEIQSLQKISDDISRELQSILVTMDKAKQIILEQKHAALQFALDPELFPVKQTADTIYLPVYVAKFEKTFHSEGEPEILYHFMTPGVWDPQGKKQTARMPAPNLLVTSMTEALQHRVESVAIKSPIFCKNLDKISQKQNLAVNLDAEEYLIAGLSQLTKSGIILARSLEELKNELFKACRLCPHCGAEVVNRKGYCSECGNPILIRTSKSE
ncbi:MAG: hypothetical protein ACTSVM_05570 [Candidatus Ranarchaeia archaeon]